MPTDLPRCSGWTFEPSMPARDGKDAMVRWWETIPRRIAAVVWPDASWRVMRHDADPCDGRPYASGQAQPGGETATTEADRALHAIWRGL